MFVLALGYFSTPDLRPASVVMNFLVALLPISNPGRVQYGRFGGQLWTIAVELQFYMLFPIFHMALERYGPRYHLSAIGFLIVIRTAVFALTGTVHDLSYFSIFGSLDVFLAGHLCGWLYKRGKLKLSNPRWIIGTFIFLNIFLWVAFRGGHFYHVPPRGQPAGHQSAGWLWIVRPDVVAVTFAVMIPAYIQYGGRIPLPSLWATCGRYSYSTYLRKILVIELVDRAHLIYFNPYALGVLIVAVTALLSAASYHLIERPFFDQRAKYTKAHAIENFALARLNASVS